MQIAGRHWLGALGAAALVHAGVAVALISTDDPSGAVSAGVGGVEISLGPAGGAPGAAAPAVEEIAEATEAPAEPVTATAEPTPVETAKAEPLPAQEVPLEQPTEPETERSETVPVERLAAVEPVEPVAEAATPVLAPPPPPPPRPRQVVEQPQRTATATITERATARAEPSEAAPTRTAALPPPPGSEGRSGNQNRKGTGSAEASSAGGIPGATADYMALLQAWLEKHKEYPRRAQLRRQEGTALLYFVIARDGRVLEYRIEQSSGYDLLDQEVQAMIERAQPLPRIPDEMQQASLELVVPVQFFLR